MIMVQLEQEKGFTGAELSAVRFIRENPQDVLGMSLAELGERAHVSQATIVRLCKKLGCQGYPAFKLRLAAEFDSLLRDGETVDVDVPFKQGASPRDISEAMFSLTYQTVRDVKMNLDENLLMRAARAIRQADYVTFYGRGESLLIAEEFRQKLVRIGYRCSSEVINGFEGAHAPRRGGREVAFVVSQYADSYQVYNTFDELIYQHVPIIMLCGTPDSPLARLADIPITVDIHETRFKIGSFAQRTAMGYVCDCLFGMIFSLDYEKNVKNLHELHERNHEHRLYVE